MINEENMHGGNRGESMVFIAIAYFHISQMFQCFNGCFAFGAKARVF